MTTPAMKRHLVGAVLILTFLIAALFASVADSAPFGHQWIDVPTQHATQAAATAPSEHPYRPLYVVAAQTAPDAIVTSPAQVGTTAIVTSPVENATAGDVLETVYVAWTEENWFLLAGAVLSGVGLLVLWLLEKRWSIFANDRVRWVTMLALAGVLGLANAWVAEDVPIDHKTFVGAVKVFVAAIAAYVTAKKLIRPANEPHVAAP